MRHGWKVLEKAISRKVNVLGYYHLLIRSSLKWGACRTPGRDIVWLKPRFWQLYDVGIWASSILYCLFYLGIKTGTCLPHPLAWAGQSRVCFNIWSHRKRPIFLFKMADIQEKSLPVPLRRKDVPGAARSGSSKTSAFSFLVPEVLYSGRSTRQPWRVTSALNALSDHRLPRVQRVGGYPGACCGPTSVQ